MKNCADIASKAIFEKEIGIDHSKGEEEKVRGNFVVTLFRSQVDAEVRGFNRTGHSCEDSKETADNWKEDNNTRNWQHAKQRRKENNKEEQTRNQRLARY